jgi:hypothetical protein
MWNGNPDTNFMFSWLECQRTDESLYEDTANSNKNNTGLVLPFSISPEGYSLLGNTYSVNTRVFVDGQYLIPTVGDGYITFPSITSENVVVADFFDGTQSLPADVYFYGAVTCVLPKGGVAVYGNPDLDRLIDGFKHMPETNMCFAQSIAFPSTEGLVEI